MEDKTKSYSNCEKYKAQDHNFCRMCGFSLRERYVRNARIAVAYTTAERCCGYCGNSLDACGC